MTAYSSHGFRRITGSLSQTEYDINITGEANGKNKTFKLPIAAKYINSAIKNKKQDIQGHKSFDLLNPDDLKVYLYDRAKLETKQFKVERINTKSGTFTLKEAPPDLVDIQGIFGYIRSKLLNTNKRSELLALKSAEGLKNGITVALNASSYAKSKNILSDINAHIDHIPEKDYINTPIEELIAKLESKMQKLYPFLRVSFTGKVVISNSVGYGGAGMSEYEECPTKTIRNIMSCITQIDIDVKNPQFKDDKFFNELSLEDDKELIRYVLKKIPKRIKVNVDYSST